jgi:hypothetical protein
LECRPGVSTLGGRYLSLRSLRKSLKQDQNDTIIDTMGCVNSLLHEPSGERRRGTGRGTTRMVLISVACVLLAALVGNFGWLSGVLPGEPGRSGGGSAGQGPTATTTVTRTVEAADIQAGEDTSTEESPSDTSSPEISVSEGPSVATTFGPPTPAGGTGIWHQGEITIQNDHGFDLDSPADDSQWGVLELPPGRKYDAWLRHGNELHTQSGTQIFRTDTAQLSACNSGTAYLEGFIDLKEKKAGTTYCWTTSEGRMALVQILGPGTHGGWSFYVTTFNKTSE